MSSRRVAQMKAALLKKGFRSVQSHHDMLWLYVGDKKTAVHTYFSNGQSTYDRQLLSSVKRQIRLRTWEQFDRFMDCPMDGTEYLKLLIKNGDVRP